MDIINDNHQHNDINNTMSYMHPDEVQNTIQNQEQPLGYNDFVHTLEQSPFFNRDYFMNNNDQNNYYYSIQFHYKQFYVRYLLRVGNVQQASGELLHILVNQNNYGYTIEQFLNYQHPSFQGESILHFALMWNASLQFIQWIITNGADINSENMFHQLPGDYIHNVVWHDPFAIYLNTNPLISDNQGRVGIRSRNHFQALDWFFQHVGEE